VANISDKFSPPPKTLIFEAKTADLSKMNRAHDKHESASAAQRCNEKAADVPHAALDSPIFDAARVASEMEILLRLYGAALKNTSPPCGPKAVPVTPEERRSISNSNNVELSTCMPPPARYIRRGASNKSVPNQSPNLAAKKSSLLRSQGA
jgi:hypothetical protein